MCVCVRVCVCACVCVCMCVVTMIITLSATLIRMMIEATSCNKSNDISHGANNKQHHHQSSSQKSITMNTPRQEAQERSRRQEQEQAIGKADYDKMIDKKQCPSCGAKQSYDEVKEKRKGEMGDVYVCEGEGGCVFV